MRAPNRSLASPRAQVPERGALARVLAVIVGGGALALLAVATPSCSDPSACEDAVVALCSRAISCSGKGTAAFVKGDASSYSVVDYGNQGSCEDQLYAYCPSNDQTANAEPFPTCLKDAGTSPCSDLTDAPGTRVPTACESVVQFLAK
ncbi:MAG: hypothetical protein U0414_38500 [Polyangiaceae bacterium]